MDYTLIVGILASIGGINGIINFFKWIKSSKAKVKIQYSIGDFYVYQDDLIVHNKILLTNERDEAVYITDVLAFIAEDPSKTKDKKGRIFTMRPTNPVFSPTKIEAKGTIDLDFEINFSRVDVHSIRRSGLLNFAGFAGDVPVMVAKESDFDEKWDDLPIEMKLFIHVNGKELIDTFVGVFPRKTTDSSYGTLDFIQVARLQKDYVKLQRDFILKKMKIK